MSSDTDSSDDIEMEDLFSMPMHKLPVGKKPGRDTAVQGTESSDEEDGEREREVFKPLISRRAKRRSLLYGTPLPALDRTNNSNQAVINEAEVPTGLKSIHVNGDRGLLSRTSSEEMSHSMSPKVKFNWMRALKKVHSMGDPWEGMGIEALPTETVVRHSYHPLKKRWIINEAEVKMEAEPFNHGAMRSCYRLKKMSSYSRQTDWLHASNYVAKLYMTAVERDVYFEDVKLQMDAKLWGEEYNRHNPPKKVDIFQMSVIEFKDRPGKPLYHLENFIEGQYIKYNSNSGFVDESHRCTPQAFSHFTFERSGHDMIVVDVQGVGDLWTDPQIHTADGLGYGDGNLGTRGMALFFHSHTCNTICQSLCLSKFDMAPSEQSTTAIIKPMTTATRVRGEEHICISASPRDRVDLHGFLMRSHSRTTSVASTSSDDHPLSPLALSDSMLHGDMDDLEEPMSPGEDSMPDHTLAFNHHRRSRFHSESSDSSVTLTEEEERIRFQESVNRMQRPSCFHAEINLLNLSNVLGTTDSTLGLIHHEMAKCHELGRFAADDNAIDMEAALFHEQQAAELGVVEARLSMARLYLGMQREVLSNYTMEENEENTNLGLYYMEKAAQAGDRPSMIYMGHAYETGLGLGNKRSKNHDEAVNWYERAVDTKIDSTGCFDSTMDSPVYDLQAKVAEMYRNGEHGLDKDASYAGEMYTAAAEGAMEAMKGRLANKYFMLAEEAWGEVED